MCKYIGSYVSCECFSAFVVSNQNNTKNRAIHVKPAVNSMPCCIKHIAGCF